jgi:hypothetical protein
MPNVNLLVVITVYNCVREPWTRGLDARPVIPRSGVESVRPHQNVQFPGVPRQPQGQSLCNGLGAGGPATQGMALRYS